LIANDDVVKQLDAENFAGLADTFGQLHILAARCRVTGGVIVLCGVPIYVKLRHPAEITLFSRETSSDRFAHAVGGAQSRSEHRHESANFTED
jgi:hypothetical protein